MTVLVGILGTDGVVIAADEAITFGPSIEQFTITDSGPKITIFDKKVIVTTTGQLGLGQRFTHVVQQLWTAGRFDRNSVAETGGIICEAAVNNFRTTGVHNAMPPGGISLNAFVGYSLDNQPQLIQFIGTDFNPEFLAPKTWYASLGSGQRLARSVPRAAPALRLGRRAAECG